MDSLSTAASLISLIEIVTQIADVCYIYRKRTEHAPKHLLQMIEELSSFRHSVERLMHFVESAEEGSNTRLATVNLLNGVDRPLEAYASELNSLSQRLQPNIKEIKIDLPFQPSTWPLTQLETLQTIQRLGRYRNTIEIAVTVEGTTLKSSIEAEVDRIARSLNVLKLEHDRREKLIRWLAAPNPTENHNAAIRVRQQFTGSWFVEGTQYREWISNPRSKLWLYGPPGCGKTILCSGAIDEALFRCSSSSTTAVAYFYFDFSNYEKQSLENLVRSLTMQLSLLGEMYSKPLEELYTYCQYGQRQPSLRELTETLHRRLQELEATYIIVDAVDECEEVEDFMCFFRDLLEWNIETVHFLATSRPDTRLRSFFTNDYPATVVSMGIASSPTYDDISAYIRENLFNDPRLRKWPKNVLEEIETALRNGANGMFRWVVCQLDILRKCLKVSDVRKALVSLPRTLDETYERILMSVHEEYVTEAQRLLQWLAYSSRPLRIEEVAEALAIDNLQIENQLNPENRLVDPRDVLTICPDLVIVSPVRVLDEIGDMAEAEELRFAHFSVKEYLISSRCSNGLLAKYSLHPEANRVIAESCIGYMFSISAKDLLEDDFQTQFPLFHYASHEWFYHVHKCPQKEGWDQLDTMIEQLLDPARPHLVNWLRMFDPDRRWSLSLNPQKPRREICSALYYASSLGLLRTVRRLISQGGDVNYTGGSLGSPLQAAAYHGHGEIVAVLLEYGADCIVRCGHYGTALQAAKFARHEAIIKELEEHDQSEKQEDQIASHIHLLTDEKAPFEVLDSIGGGGSGIVEMVRNLSDGSVCVRKTCKTRSSSARKEFLEEVRIMQKLRHIHVVEVLGSYSRGRSSSILLLPLADKDLGDFMDEMDNEEQDQVELLVKWTVCLAEGLRYIHSKNVKHKDIKPQNLLVHGDKILYTDFGIAHDFEGSVSVTAGNTGMTRRYSAPEVVAGDERSRAADIFSLGCVFLEMLEAILEWRLDDFGDDDDYATYVQENRPKISHRLQDIQPATGPYRMRGFDTFPLVPDLTLLMLTVSPQERPRASVLASELKSKDAGQRAVCQCRTISSYE